MNVLASVLFIVHRGKEECVEAKESGRELYVK